MNILRNSRFQLENNNILQVTIKDVDYKAVIFIFILLFSRNHCSLIQIQYMVDDANYIPLFSCVKINKAFSIYRK